MQTEVTQKFIMEFTNITNITFDDNITTTIKSEYSQSFVIPMSVILIIVIIVAFTGNAMVILTVIRHSRMRTRTNLFITNLAISDLLTACFDMPISLITLIKGEWILGEETGFWCQFNGFTMALFLITSIHTLMCISIHKCLSMTRPFSRFMTKRRIIIMIICTWLWSFIYGISAVLGWNKSVFKAGATQCGPSYPDNPIKKSHSLVNTLVNFVLPLTILSVCYYKTFKEIRCHMTRMLNTSNMNYRNTVMQQKKIAVTLFLIMACFMLSFMPYVGYSCAAAFYKNSSKGQIPSILNPVAYWFIYVNCAWNPILYAIRSSAFRQGYKEIMCGKRFAYFSTGSFRSTSQRSWSFKSSRKSSVNYKMSGSLHGPMIHPVHTRSLSNGSSGVLAALDVTKNHSSPVIAFSDKKKPSSPNHSCNSPAKLKNVYISLPNDDISNTRKDENNDKNHADNVEIDKTNGEPRKCKEETRAESFSTDANTFYDSDVELEHVAYRRKHRRHRRQSRSMYAASPGGTVTHLVKAQTKLMNVNDYLTAPRPSMSRPRSMSDLTPKDFKDLVAAHSAIDIPHCQNRRQTSDNYLDAHSIESLKKNFIPSPKLSLSKRLATSLGLFRSRESNISNLSKTSIAE